jgi:hypothetical protein
MSRVLAQSVAILLEDEREEGRAQIDMAISLRVADVDTTGTSPRYRKETDEELIRVGGRWDRRERRWIDEADRYAIVRVPRGGEQEIAARWLAEWFYRAGQGPRGAHWDDFERVWTMMLVGGRRGGKSYLATAGCCMFAVMVPGSLVWAVSPTQDETDELEQAFRAILPTDWYTYRGGGAGKPLQFRFAHGSRLLCLSGHKPRSLKRGRVDLALYNEGQNMYRAGWTQLRGAVADTGGLVLIAANPPDAEIGRWIEDLHEKAVKKTIKAATFKLTAATNPFVEMQALSDMADEVDDLTYRREVLGEFVPIGDTVMHSWSDTFNVIDEVPAGWIDVTADEAKRELGRPAEYVVGMDFQQTPHMPADVYKLFRNPDGGFPDEVVPVILDEVVREDASEDDLIDGLEKLPRWQRDGRVDGDCYRGKEGAYCAVVMDASAWWQDGAHTKGKTSDRKLRDRGWVWLFKPQRDSDRNPDILERVKATNARLKAADVRDQDGKVIRPGRRRMFVLRHCALTIRALRSWENRGGVPYRKSQYAHICDAVSYPIYRFFGVPKMKGGKAEYRSVGARHDRGDLFPRR